MVASPQSLPLRGAHLPPAPSWWPPAPGWWLLLALIAVGMAAWLFLLQRRRRRVGAWNALFAAANAQPSPRERIAAISELLRRAARGVDANAINLQGDDWLRFLDASTPRGFVAGAGRVLLDGAFRRDVEAAEADALCEIAQARFLELMAAGQ